MNIAVNDIKVGRPSESFFVNVYKKAEIKAKQLGVRIDQLTDEQIDDIVQNVSFTTPPITLFLFPPAYNPS